MRTGRKFASPHAVVYVVPTNAGAPARFGFIVSKAVGNSVARHFVTRRLRAVAHDLLPVHSSGVDVIVRALPGADRMKWDQLQSEVDSALAKATSARGDRSNSAQSGVTR